VQYELRQRVIEPRRKTFQNIIDRNGDRAASRYEEGTLDVQPTENFHYRPLWDPAHELYDESYSALRLTDPYSYRDPRQFYYTPYVASRAGMYDAFGKTLRYLEERDLLARLPAGWRSAMETLLVPLRHYEAGAQLIFVAGARFAYGTAVEQCLSYAAFDRIGAAQMISRIGIDLDGGTADLLAEAKTQWSSATVLQPLRRLVEELLIEPDWAVGLVALDFVDRLLYPLLYRHLDEAALLQGAGAYSLLAQHFAGWFDDERRWLDALLAEWVADEAHGSANRTALQAVTNTWLPRAVAAATAIAEQVDRLVEVGAMRCVDDAATTVRASLRDLGIS